MDRPLAKRLRIARSVARQLPSLGRTFSTFSDEHSRSLFVELLAFRLMGARRVQLSRNTPEFWENYSQAEGYKVEEGRSVGAWMLSRFRLQDCGRPIELVANVAAINATFLMQQYFYQNGPIQVRVEKGDTVLDAGGCWGDTALYFANRVGARGKVYTFEFEPQNLEILPGNLHLNAELARRIQIVQQALWDQADETLHFEERGPGTSLLSPGEASSGSVVTTTIDEFVATRRIERVDFVKMDIEGSEMRALRGASETLRRFRPKLAISIYHRLQDMAEIPLWLSDLSARYHLGYRFFLDHFSIHQEETILFARTQA